MTDKELIAALRRNMAETGSLRCLGCGYEHGCNIHGCAIVTANLPEWCGVRYYTMSALLACVAG
ncbi:MAG: hypothetical protein RR743_01040 [Oscillospiraceae bacterium]